MSAAPRPPALPLTGWPRRHGPGWRCWITGSAGSRPELSRPAEIRGNALKDLAALNKVEMPPWDEWGRMTASYEGRTGAEYERLIDTVAAVCAGDDTAAMVAP